MPAAAMQRTTQRLNAWPAMISPNSNSDSSRLFAETRCADETRRSGDAARAGVARRASRFAPGLLARDSDWSTMNASSRRGGDMVGNGIGICKRDDCSRRRRLRRAEAVAIAVRRSLAVVVRARMLPRRGRCAHQLAIERRAHAHAAVWQRDA